MESKLEDKTVVELKDLLRERGLKVSGKKAELVERLLGRESPKAVKSPKGRNPGKATLEKKTVVELKEMLREQGLKVSGTKTELIDRLTGKETIKVPSEKTVKSRKSKSEKVFVTIENSYGGMGEPNIAGIYKTKEAQLKAFEKVINWLEDNEEIKNAVKQFSTRGRFDTDGDIMYLSYTSKVE